MLDETSTGQRLVAELIGTAFLVFIGVGSVPATLIVNGNAPFTMADLGMISLAGCGMSSVRVTVRHDLITQREVYSSILAILANTTLSTQRGLSWR